MTRTSKQGGDLPSRKAEVGEYLMRNATRIRSLMPKGVDQDRFFTIALSTATDPQLSGCSLKSVVLSVLRMTQLGLDPGLNEANILPFQNRKTGEKEATFIPQYHGLLRLAYQGGQVKRICAREVYEQDEYLWDAGADTVVHRPTADPERGEVAAAYCKVWLEGIDSPHIEWMWRHEIDAVRARAKAKEGPWVTDYPMQARKTVLKRALKYVPKSTNAVRAMIAEDEDEDTPLGDLGGIFDAEVLEAPTAGNGKGALDRVMQEKAARHSMEEAEPPPAAEEPPPKLPRGEKLFQQPEDARTEAGKRAYLIQEVQKMRLDPRFEAYLQERSATGPQDLNDSDLVGMVAMLRS